MTVMGVRMARVKWVEERLCNWARWKVMRGRGPLGYAAVNLADADAGRSGYIEASVPVDDVEASETNDAVLGLTPELQRTLLAVYCGEGAGSGGVRQAARRLHLGESAVHARIDRAHRLMAQAFGERDERRKQERARVEALQAAMRPV